MSGREKKGTYARLSAIQLISQGAKLVLRLLLPWTSVQDAIAAS